MLNYDNIKLHVNLMCINESVMCDIIFVMQINFE